MLNDFPPSSLCILCTFQTNCPRPLLKEDRQEVWHCNYFIEQNFPKEKALILKMNLKRGSRPLSSSSPQTSELVQEIIQRQAADTRGMLTTYCGVCMKEMDKIMTPKQVFYRCPNYPECDVNADPKSVSEAVIEEETVKKREYGQISALYEYSEELNCVTVKFV